MRTIKLIIASTIILSVLNSCKKERSGNNLSVLNVDSTLHLAKSVSINDFPRVKQNFISLLEATYSSQNTVFFLKILNAYVSSAMRLNKESELIISLNELLDTIDLPYYRSALFTALSNVYYNLGDTEIAVEYDLKALDEATLLGDSLRIVYCLNNLAVDYFFEGYVSKANNVLDKAYKTAVRLKDSTLIAITTSNKGLILMGEGKFEESLRLLEFSKRLSKKIGDWPGLTYCNFYIGSCYFEKKNFKLASIYFDSVNETSANFLFKKDKLDYFLKKTRTELLLKRNDFAHSTFEKYLALKDTIQSNSKTKELQRIKLDQYYKKENEKRNLKYIGVGSVLIIIIVILGIGYFFTVKTRLLQKKSFAELNNLKSRFFANISHEFRTPLTLLLGPLEKGLRNASSKEEKDELSMMHRNASRLLILVNQLLDLSRLEAGTLKLRCVHQELNSFIQSIASQFSSMADSKGIHFEVKANEPILLFFDSDKLEKIITNLLSNAFKFTNSGGSIILNIKQHAATDQFRNGFGEITVNDNGKGIEEEHLTRIFDRFYQVDTSNTRSYEGSGIGLALTKELVDLHHGTISVISKPGSGSSFILQLPMGKDHLKEDEIDSTNTYIQSHAVTSHNNDLCELEITGKNDSFPKILLVEDNADLRYYLRSNLIEYYHVVEAADGEKGVTMAINEIPDLIISDLMMPKVDGLQLCEKLKANEKTSHIPIILLTAKADIETKLSGLKIGADDYMAKPFDARELGIRVNNLIEGRKKLQHKFSQRLSLSASEIAVDSMEDRFIRKVQNTIESHISDATFSVEILADEAAMSSVQLYRKLKALTGYTPNELIRNIRLERGASLLRQHAGGVSEVAYQVGFNNLSYFAKVFKDKYGVTPSEYSGSRDE